MLAAIVDLAFSALSSHDLAFSKVQIVLLNFAPSKYVDPY